MTPFCNECGTLERAFNACPRGHDESGIERHLSSDENNRVLILKKNAEQAYLNKFWKYACEYHGSEVYLSKDLYKDPPHSMRISKGNPCAKGISLNRPEIFTLKSRLPIKRESIEAEE